MEESKNMRERNYGIDLMRIVSMVYVLVLHTLGQGGMISSAVTGSKQEMIIWALEIWAFCAVDIFALISGYVGYCGREKPTKFANLFELWLQVVFYSVLITLYYRFRYPESVTGTDLIKSFFPVTFSTYWYFVAYTGLFFLMPVINRGLRSCSEVTARKVLIALLFVFSGYEVLFSKFGMEDGLSVIWLAILYIIGAIIRKCEIGKNMNPLFAFVGVVLLEFATLGILISHKSLAIADYSITGLTFVSYVSPFIAGMAIFYVIGASKLRLPKACNAVIGFAAPGAFAAYILNNHTLVWNNWMAGRFATWASLSVLQIIIHVFGFSIAFVVVAILIDHVRMLIFKLLHLKQFCQFLEKWIRIGLDRIVA